MLRKELSKVKRVTSFQNFSSASNVGIICYSDDGSFNKESCKFIDFIKQKGLNVYGLGISPQKDLITSSPHIANFEYFGLDEVNWYGKPIGDDAIDFVKQKSDILIDISMADFYAVKYIFATANSKFKITSSGEKEQFADFVIQSDEIKIFTKNVVRYLQSIRVE